MIYYQVKNLTEVCTDDTRSKQDVKEDRHNYSKHSMEQQEYPGYSRKDLSLEAND